jgi:hypothetical protein
MLHALKHLHRPFVSAAKAAHRVATHPATRSVGRFSWHVGKASGKAIYKVATHPTTAHITHKAWFHGTKAAKHTTRFLMKVAAKGFSLRGQ